MKPGKLKDPVELFNSCRGRTVLNVASPHIGACRLVFYCDEPKYSVRVAWEVFDKIPDEIKACSQFDPEKGKVCFWVFGDRLDLANVVTEACRSVLGEEHPTGEENGTPR